VLDNKTYEIVVDGLSLVAVAVNIAVPTGTEFSGFDPPICMSPERVCRPGVGDDHPVMAASEKVCI